MCDVPWGHKGRLFRVPQLTGLPQHGGEDGGRVGTDFPWARCPSAAAGTRQLVGGWGCSGGVGVVPLPYKGARSPQSLPQVGCFDPYSDDPRLGVQKIVLCKYTAKMVVAGTAGQVGW